MDAQTALIVTELEGRITNMRVKCDKLEALWASLEDRVAVMEENTCTHDARLEELEDWQKKVDDALEDM